MIPPGLFFLASLAGSAPAPPWAQGEIRLYDTAQIPVLRGDSTGALSSGFKRSLDSAGGGDTGSYRLDFAGNKSLSVSVGPEGGVGVDASLQVDIKGQASENVFLEGSLSDQNVPVQPEGNTANLREVDTKFLRVYGRQYEYLLGDYLLVHGREGEDGFSIKAEGARLGYARSGAGVTAQYALSKGIFQFDTLRGEDGKQGGYYLRARDGRIFITVLAGTEKIRRNGILLRRGSDYTLDYAEGRVDFLKGVRVTGENLFAAEFQYLERDFPRSVAASEIRDSAGPFRFSARAIQEWDDQGHPAAGIPDEGTLLRYRLGGDSLLLDSLGRPVSLPQRLAGTVLAAEWDAGEAGGGRFVLLGSLWDPNLYSDRDDADNLGFSTRYRGVHRFGNPLDQGGFSRLEIEPSHEHRSANFNSFHQPVEPRSFRDQWNLGAAVGERDFDANSLRLSLEPASGLRVGAGGGWAFGRMQDTNHAESKRGEAFGRLDAGPVRLEASAEAKLASDPGRRDNYRQRVEAGALLADWNTRTRLLHDTWLTEVPLGTAQSRLWQPELSLESPTLGNRWTWGAELDALYGRSNYDAVLPDPADSLLDVGLSQNLRLLSWGPFHGEVYASRRLHRQWLLQADGARARDPLEEIYDQAQADFSASGYSKGYELQSHYQVTRTAEAPLINAYQKVDSGRGEYVYDSLLNAYQRVELGGDYVFTGLQRDTTLGRRPYQDVQWNLRVDLSPGQWPASPGGVLADLDFSVDVAADHQDSAPGPGLWPRLTDAQIEAARSGRARFEPSLRWRGSGGRRSAMLRFQREYAKGAGIEAFRERSWRTEAEYRLALNEEWEALWGGAADSRSREGLASPGSESRVEGLRTRVELYRRLPLSMTLVPVMEYERARGEDAGFALDLHGVTPRLRLEKGEFYGGRASMEYALRSLFGEGEGGYFTTGGYRKGMTHRVEILAHSQVQTHLHLSLSYLARLEPRASSWDQRMSAEMRAVF